MPTVAGCITMPPTRQPKRNERLMATETYLYQGEYARSLVAKGEAKALLLVLEAREIPVPEQARERISACTDIPMLQTWIKRAALIDTIDDLFA
ncbi:hypothetical protein [Nonomuraea sp. SBT364]|uniref:hypothetical protein n=1 Tax=Nonomuraea sp. SBT364 TaxID=1580530 RepID=UPI000AD281BF|nr:hypothetical protein [Nonomuraea sp. SBT364]